MDNPLRAPAGAVKPLKGGVMSSEIVTRQGARATIQGRRPPGSGRGRSAMDRAAPARDPIARKGQETALRRLRALSETRRRSAGESKTPPGGARAFRPTTGDFFGRGPQPDNSTAAASSRRD
ncbi:unnamed protein product [Amoebophrya sp. A120]|nr:unnamed protein product [Amoebophrya sp. A120]|eukprot:GSA120T00001168001.1